MQIKKPKIRIYEVGPRDGLQNELRSVSLGIKLELIKKLQLARLQTIECTSFVSPKWVPQMSDHCEILELVQKLDGNCRFPVLVPNLKGFERYALMADPHKSEIAVLVAASEGFSVKNINKPISKSLAETRELVRVAISSGFQIRGYLSCVIACPYDGKTDPSRVADITSQLLDFGCYQVSLGDTIGVGTPGTIGSMLERVVLQNNVGKLAIHAHDTYGQGVANSVRAVEMGITTVDASVGGLGGCPYARGATGNVATEEVVYALEGMYLDTQTDLDELCKASLWISRVLGREPSKCAKAFAARHLNTG